MHVRLFGTSEYIFRKEQYVFLNIGANSEFEVSELVGSSEQDKR